MDQLEQLQNQHNRMFLVAIERIRNSSMNWKVVKFCARCGIDHKCGHNLTFNDKEKALRVSDYRCPFCNSVNFTYVRGERTLFLYCGNPECR
jgi:Zn finger protein HypA/HybF involved in hydrogenase expression